MNKDINRIVLYYRKQISGGLHAVKGTYEGKIMGVSIPYSILEEVPRPKFLQIEYQNRTYGFVSDLEIIYE